MAQAFMHSKWWCHAECQDYACSTYIKRMEKEWINYAAVERRWGNIRNERKNCIASSPKDTLSSPLTNGNVRTETTSWEAHPYVFFFRKKKRIFYLFKNIQQKIKRLVLAKWLKKCTFFFSKCPFADTINVPPGMLPFKRTYSAASTLPRSPRK